MQEEAADRRRQENESRGVKDPEKVRRMQQRAKDLENQEIAAQRSGEPALKVGLHLTSDSVFAVLLLTYIHLIFSGKQIEPKNRSKKRTYHRVYIGKYLCTKR